SEKGVLCWRDWCVSRWCDGSKRPCERDESSHKIWRGRWKLSTISEWTLRLRVFVSRCASCGFRNWPPPRHGRYSEHTDGKQMGYSQHPAASAETVSSSEQL